MIKKIIFIQMLLGVFILWYGVDSAFSRHPLDIVIKSSSEPLPSTKPGIGVACYDFFTLDPLDCPFTLIITALVDDGGHVKHTPSLHPLIDPEKVTLEFNGIDDDGSPLGIKSKTEEKRAIIKIPLPEVAGAFLVEILTESPEGYVCARSCFTRTSSKREHTFDVKIAELTPLPNSGPHHITVRGDVAEHPKGTHGTGDTIQALQEIARVYFGRTGRKLSINDVSLPKGGLFDTGFDWETPHDTHREGKDADLNRADGGGVIVDCEEELTRIVEKVAGENPRPRLECESGDRRHIDF